MDGQVKSPMKLLATTKLVTLHGSIAAMDNVDTGLRVLEESFRILLPLLAEPVGIVLILCAVLAAVTLALHAGMLVAELQKARQ